INSTVVNGPFGSRIGQRVNNGVAIVLKTELVAADPKVFPDGVGSLDFQRGEQKPATLVALLGDNNVPFLRDREQFVTRINLSSYGGRFPQAACIWNPKLTGLQAVIHGIIDDFTDLSSLD